jgi:hypothetical protein
MTVRKQPKSRTRYYEWEGEACRLHKKENGDEVADLYRGGRGLVRVSPTDLHLSARPIGPACYQQLRDEQKTLYERKTLKS